MFLWSLINEKILGTDVQDFFVDMYLFVEVALVSNLIHWPKSLRSFFNLYLNCLKPGLIGKWWVGVMGEKREPFVLYH